MNSENPDASYDACGIQLPARDVIIHSQNRRAFWHDYKSRCIYMVTITRNETLKKDFSSILNAGSDASGRLNAITELSDWGKIIWEEIYRLEHFYQEVQIIKSVVMPDHVHFIVFVREHFDLGLGGIVKFFKGNCTKRIRDLFPDNVDPACPLFRKGYNDRIVFRAGMLDTLVNYIADNPRRLLIRHLYPSFFRKVKRLIIQDRVFDAYGNLDLLYEPAKSPLIISSRYTDNERKQYETDWTETLRCGGAFVSPFISEQEKARRNEYIEGGASVIHIVDYSFGERYKPSGKMFYLCALGRLLLLSEVSMQTEDKEMRRSRAIKMNDTARWLIDFTKSGTVKIARK